MDTTISKQAMAEVLGALRDRYLHAPKSEKTRTLDQFVAVAGCHRKHAIRLLAGPLDATETSGAPQAPWRARRRPTDLRRGGARGPHYSVGSR